MLEEEGGGGNKLPVLAKQAVEFPQVLTSTLIMSGYNHSCNL